MIGSSGGRFMVGEPLTGAGWSLPVDSSELPLPRVQVPKRTSDGSDTNILLPGFQPFDK